MVDHWRGWFGGVEGLRVGLVWAGNPAHPGDRQRSMPLAALVPLGSLPDITWFSLQTGQAAAQLDRPPAGLALHDGGRLLREVADTAAVLAHLDAVVTVDTAVAHLAGALGRSVWTMLPSTPDWRWGLAGETTAWYPTMRLVRQERPQDWAAVVQRVGNAVRRLRSGEPY